MKRIPKQEYTVQFKEQAVAMVKNGKSVAEVARVLGVVEQTLRNWVKLVKAGKLRAGAKEVTAEQMELSRLRAENAQLKLENEILKKATRRTSQKMLCEVRLDREESQVLSAGVDVQRAGC